MIRLSNRLTTRNSTSDNDVGSIQLDTKQENCWLNLDEKVISEMEGSGINHLDEGEVLSFGRKFVGDKVEESEIEKEDEQLDVTVVIEEEEMPSKKRRYKSSVLLVDMQDFESHGNSKTGDEQPFAFGGISVEDDGDVRGVLGEQLENGGGVQIDDFVGMNDAKKRRLEVSDEDIFVNHLRANIATLENARSAEELQGCDESEQDCVLLI